MVVLGLTGQSGVGKSTIARALSGALGAPLLVGRDILHGFAQKYGFSRGRDWFATIDPSEGHRQARMRTIELLAGITDAPVVIFDGLYDAKLPTEIRDTWPSIDVRIIVITAPYEISIARMAQRLGSDVRVKAIVEIEFLDKAKINAGMEILTKQATLTYENSGTIDDARLFILAHCGLTV
jgi:dephospho-CoA kinase